MILRESWWSKLVVQLLYWSGLGLMLYGIYRYSVNAALIIGGILLIAHAALVVSARDNDKDTS